MDYHMQFLKFLYILPKHGLSYAIFEISSSYPKTWTIICNFWNIFPFSKNMDYYIQFLEFHFILQKHGLLYVIFGISFSSPKTLTIVCNHWNFFTVSKVDYHMQF